MLAPPARCTGPETSCVVLALEIYHAHRDDVVPLLTFLGALGAASGILWQAATARKRHYEQTEADRRRRITESFSKAAEQLASEKIEARLGGIYTLERIS
jgi:hypothetical protein